MINHYRNRAVQASLLAALFILGRAAFGIQWFTYLIFALLIQATIEWLLAVWAWWQRA